MLFEDAFLNYILNKVLSGQYQILTYASLYNIDVNQTLIILSYIYCTALLSRILCFYKLLGITRQFVNKLDICEETYCTTHLHTLMYRKTSPNKHLRIYYVLKVKSFTKKKCVSAFQYKLILS